METPISSDNPEVSAADNPSGHAAVVDGTAQDNGQPEGTGHVGDLFEGIDPAKLPPELRPHLDSMVRTYREKTEKLSERVKTETQKAVEVFKQKADWYDNALKDEALVKMINDHLTKASQPDPSKSSLPPEVQEKLQKVDLIEREIQTTKTLEAINTFADAKDDKGNPVHPNFDKYHSMTIGENFSILNAAFERAPGKNLQEKMENGYKALDAIWNKAVEEGKKLGMGRIQEKAKNGTFSPSSVNAGSTAPRQPKNALEALQFARQGLAPNRG